MQLIRACVLFILHVAFLESSLAKAADCLSASEFESAAERCFPGRSNKSFSIEFRKLQHLKDLDGESLRVEGKLLLKLLRLRSEVRRGQHYARASAFLEPWPGDDIYTELSSFDEGISFLVDGYEVIGARFPVRPTRLLRVVFNCSHPGLAGEFLFPVAEVDGCLKIVGFNRILRKLR